MKNSMKKSSVLKLLQTYAEIINKLREGGVLRSSNNPVADYAEYLVSKKFKLKLAPNSNKSFDATDLKTGEKFQIKSRRLTKFSNRRQLGIIRSLDFDYLVAVIFKENFEVLEAYKIPKELIKPPYVRFSKLQNGYILILSGPILKDRAVEKIKL